MAIVVGVEREFIAREQGVERLEKITHFLSNADRFHGVWPHFLDGRAGKVIPYFGKYDDGGDLVETAFLMAIASPTHAVPPASTTAVRYRQGWGRTTQGITTRMETGITATNSTLA
jgi:hypothetical protein